MLDALGSLHGTPPDHLKGTASSKARAKWFDLFSNFGTHYIKELIVGGKVRAPPRMDRLRLPSEWIGSDCPPVPASLILPALAMYGR